MSTRLAQLLALRDRLDDEITAEQLRAARVNAATDQIRAASNAVLDQVPDYIVRAWAQQNGVRVPKTGRVSRKIRARYLEAHEGVTV